MTGQASAHECLRIGRHLPTRQVRVVWMLAAFCSTFGADAGWAQASSSSITQPAADRTVIALEQAWVHESNPLRLAPGQPRAADSAGTSAVEGSHEVRWGRQRWSGNGRWSSTRYANEEALDHEAYRWGMTLDLQTAGDLGARAFWREQRDPLEGQLRLDPQTGQRRLQTIEQQGVSLLWGLQRRWTMELQWRHDQLEPNRPQSWWPGYEQDSWRLQWRGQTAGLMNWGLGRRELQGTQFAVATGSGQQPALEYRQGAWEAEWAWTPTPAQSWVVRVAQGEGSRTWSTGALEENPAIPRMEQGVRNLQAEWRWRPQGPWSLQAQWSRDQGQQAQAAATWVDAQGLLVLQGASDVRQARAALQWDFTHSASIFASWNRIDRIGRQSWTLDPLSAAGSLADQVWQDRLDRWALGWVWQLAHGVSLRCAAQHEARRGTALEPVNARDQTALVLWRDTGLQCSVRWAALRRR